MEEGPRVNSQESLIQLIHLHFKKLPLPMQRTLTPGAPQDFVLRESSGLSLGKKAYHRARKTRTEVEIQNCQIIATE